MVLPNPYKVLLGVGELVFSGEIASHLFASLYRVALGFFLGVTLAIPIGFFFGWNKKLYKASYPLIEMLRTVSPISWIPLAIIWFGIGDLPAIFILAIATFFPTFLATFKAYTQTPEIIIKTSKNFGAKGSSLFFKVLLPSCLPRIFVGLKISLGIAWMVIVAAEMVGMRSGLGYLVLDSRNAIRTDLVIASMIIIGIVGVLLDYTMNIAESYFIKGVKRG